MHVAGSRSWGHHNQYPAPRHKPQRAIHRAVLQTMPKQSRRICKLCNITFADSSQLRLHARTEPLHRATFGCDDCNRGFIDETALKSHRESTHRAWTAKVYQTREAYRERKLIDPFKTTDTTTIHCEICNVTLNGWRAHIHKQTKAHNGQCKARGFYCGACDMVFLNNEELQTHNSRVHGLETSQMETSQTETSRMERPKTEIQNPEAQKAKNPTTKKLRWALSRSARWASSRSASAPVDLEPTGYQTILHCEVCDRTLVGIIAGIHMRTVAHFEKCKAKGLYCATCEKAFMNDEELQSHHAQGHGQAPKSTNTASNRGHGYGPIPQGTSATNFLASKNPIGKCGICDEPYYQAGDCKRHKRTIGHIEMCRVKGFYCTACQKAFSGAGGIATHNVREHDPNRPTEFRCCECNNNFNSSTLLRKHMRTHKPKKRYECFPCKLEFTTKKTLNQHLCSEKHRPLKCLGSTNCTKTFKNLSALIMHLESGACCSKLDKKTIDGLIRTHDTTNAITMKTEPAAISLPQGQVLGHAASALARVVELEADDGESDKEYEIYSLTSTPTYCPSIGSEDGGVTFTPTSSGTAAPIGMFTPSSDDTETPTGVFTPVSGDGVSEVDVYLASGVKSCPLCLKKFSTVTGLQHHIASPVHTLPMYHCPMDFLVEIGVKQDHKKPERVFKTLSALAQHIEAGACAGGPETLEKVIKFVEAKLGGFGFAGVRLIAGVN